MDFKDRLFAATALSFALPLAPAFAQEEEQQQRVAQAQAADQQTLEEQTAEQQPTTAPAQAEGNEEIVVVGRFNETGAKSAMKMNVSVLDTPFAVSSYSDDFVKSLETSNVQDLYNYMTGVKKSGNTAYDLQMRGYRTSGDDRNAIMVDGLPGLTSRFGSPPTIGVERIELVKGPMSVLYGAMQPGGFVNMILKKPLKARSTTLEFRGQTYVGRDSDFLDRNSYPIALDATGPLTDALLYRVVAEHSERNLFRDFSGDRSTYVVPSMTWNIGPSTSLTGLVEYRRLRQRFDTGLVAPNNDTSLIAPITTRYNEPDNFRREKGLGTNLFLTHDFGGWSWNTGFRNVDYESHQQDYSPVNTVLKSGSRWVVTRRARELATERLYRYLDTNLTGEFDTFGIEHKLLVGVNAGKDTVEENRLKFFNTSQSNASGVCPNAFCFDIDLYNPVYGIVPNIDDLPATNPFLRNQDRTLTHRLFETTNWGLYVSDLVTITDWLKVALSGRAFREKQRISELRQPNVPVQDKSTKKNLLPSVGVLIQPTSKLTVYGSYSEAYVPADPDSQDITGRNPFGPVSSDQVELGVKTVNLLDGVTATAALYRINQTGLLQTFNCPTGSIIDGVLVTAAGNCSEPVGATRSQGVEVEANVSFNPSWQVLAGYAYTDAKVTEDRNPALVGARLHNVPKHSANMWTRYDFDNGIGLGLGIVHTGQREGKLVPIGSPGRLNLPAYTVVDAGLYYTRGPFSANLKVGNVLDKEYLESSGAGSLGHLQIAPGAPRNVVFSTRYSF